jgi:dTDP-4-amino-4,6-dideoxygalactose transaminase
MIPVNDLHRSYLSVAEQVDRAIARVLASGRYSLGEEVIRFEREFAEFVGTGHCVGTASGSDALEIALRAVGCREGSEVVTAANCGMYTTLAARRIGAHARFADVTPETMNLTASSVFDALGSRTGAVVVTHLYGLLADIEPIVELCRLRSVPVIEDCAQAVGAARNGRRAGSFGDIAAFSFYPTKNLGALGDGGAVLTNSPTMAEVARSLRQYGWGARYQVVREGGFNSRLDELQAAVLSAKLPFVEAWNERRRSIATAYGQALDPSVGTMATGRGTDYVGHLAVIAARNRPELQRRFHDHGIATAIHYPFPDHRQPVLGATYRTVDLPVTEHLAEQVLTIPLFPELEDFEIERISEVLSKR